MKPKTELFLYHLLWMAEPIMNSRPTSFLESFEGWAYRQGLLAQVQRLEAAGLVECDRRDKAVGLFLRITEAGRVRALGGRDPEREWSTPWDGKWRLVLFDLPAKEMALRRRLLRTLAECGCGCLQGSVWISARNPAFAKCLRGDHDRNCRSLLLLDANSKGAASDHEIVESSWNFGRINRNYSTVLDLAGQFPKKAKNPSELLEWSREENAAWLKAVTADPMLPEKLLPPHYLGQKAWATRQRLLVQAARLARTFAAK